MSATLASHEARARIAAPLLLGTLAGSLVAGRFETALGCIAIALWLTPDPRRALPEGRTLGLLAGGAALSIMLNLYLVDGAPIAALPRLFGRAATVAGLVAGAVLALRVIGATLAVRALGAWWPGERAADELARLLAPLGRLGVPVTEARSVAALAVRFQPLLVDESRRIAALQELRAGRPPRGAFERTERARARLVPVMVSALERAEQVSLALEARHYRMRPVARAGPPSWPARLGGAAIAGTALFWRG